MKHLIKSCSQYSQQSYTKDSIYHERWLTTEQAAKYLGLTKKALLNLNSLGRVPYFKFGRSNRYLASELDNLIKLEPRGIRHGNKTN